MLNVQYLKKFSSMYCIILSSCYIFVVSNSKKCKSMGKSDTTVAQMRKGVLELCTLAAISTGEVYASDILTMLKDAELLVVEGTLYPILTRLKNDGYLTYRWIESSSGPPRKYYSITTDGHELLKELKEGWGNLVGSVNKLMGQINESKTNGNREEQK